MKLDLIVFDCDGVLLASKAANDAFYNRILRDLDMPPMTDEQAYWTLRFSTRDSLEMLCEEYQDKLDEALEICSRLASAGSEFLPAYGVEPEIHRSLEKCAELAPLAINTNRGKSLLDLLDHFELRSFFPVNVTAEEVTEPKPHPEGLLKLIDHYGASPGRTVFVGDAESDAYCAVAARTWFVAFAGEPPGWPLSTPSLAELQQVLRQIAGRLEQGASPAESYRY